MNWHEMVGDGVFAWRGANRGLMLGVWWNVGLLVLSVAALPFDRRTILGLNPWIKPIKFEISVTVFLLTIAVLLTMLGRLGDWPQWRATIAWGIGVTMLVENSVIAMQAARGVRSHMNYSTPFDGAAFAVMGLAVAISTVLLAVLLVLYGVTRTGLPQALTWGICLGIVAALAGSAEGVMMISRYGAHTVGASDGGPGMPFVNWSRSHGDLRVAHFLALHALQIFPITGWLMTRTELPGWGQTSATVAVVVMYSVVVWMLFAQAVAGRPLLG